MSGSHARTSIGGAADTIRQTRYPRGMLRPALVFIGLLACNPGAPAPAPAATQTAPKAEVTKTAPAPVEAVPAAIGCAERVAAIRGLFAQRSDESVVFNTPEGMQLPETTGGGGGGSQEGIPVFIRADGSFEFNSETTTLAALKDQLGEEFEKAKQLGEMIGRPYQPRLVIIADARARATVIRDLAAELPPETTLSLIANLAGDTLPTPPPIPAAVTEAIAGPAEQRSPQFAALLTTAIGSCTALSEVFQAVAETTADMRSTVLLDGLPGAIERCRCEGMDLETVVAVVWSMSGKQTPNTRSLALPLARKREAGDLLPTDATIRDLVRRVEAPAAKPIRFAATP